MACDPRSQEHLLILQPLALALFDLPSPPWSPGLFLRYIHLMLDPVWPLRALFGCVLGEAAAQEKI